MPPKCRSLSCDKLRVYRLNQDHTSSSYRHLSRDGDDSIIWSFLISENASKDPIKIWRSQEGRKINTGFLLSSAPRIQGCPGLSWAPSTPTVRLPGSSRELTTKEKSYLASDSADTQKGTITPEGLRGFWLIHQFSVTTASHGHVNVSQPSDDNDELISFDEIINRYLKDSAQAALLRPCGVKSEGVKAVPYRGEADGTLLAVCSVLDSGQAYKWKGVFEWDADEPLPEFTRQSVLLV